MCIRFNQRARCFQAGSSAENRLQRAIEAQRVRLEKVGHDAMRDLQRSLLGMKRGVREYSSLRRGSGSAP